MAAKQILSLVVASIWVVNLLSDNLKRAEEKSSGYRTKRVGFIGDGASKLLLPSPF